MILLIVNCECNQFKGLKAEFPQFRAIDIKTRRDIVAGLESVDGG